jgi:hypothetical protein
VSTAAIGAAHRLTTEVRSNGILINPTSISVTIQLPDATTDGPFAPVNDSIGVYHYDYTPATAGRHIARWVTSNPAGANEEPFEVAATWGEAGIISLDGGKKQLNISAADTSDDEEITGFIQALTAPIERIVGSVVRRTWVEKHQGGYAVALLHPPVLSITSVVAIRSGVTAPAIADLDLDGPTGIVERLDGGWICGPLRWTVLSGRSDMPANVDLAARLILQHMWDTQRGRQGAVRRGGSEEVYDPRFGFSIPRRAQELLGSQAPGVA